MDGFKDGYSDSGEFRTFSRFSTRSRYITDINGMTHTREDVESKREELAKGVRNTLLSQMREENERSLEEARKMQEAHKNEYQGMTEILKNLKDIRFKLESAKLNQIEAHMKAGDKYTREAQNYAILMGERNTAIMRHEEELRPRDADPQNPSDESEQVRNEREEQRERTDVFQANFNRLSDILTENYSDHFPSLSWWERRKASKNRDSADKAVKELENTEKQKGRELKLKAESWNNRRKSYYEGSFRKSYERYDMAARRYRIMTRGEDVSTDYHTEEHGKNIREYRGEFDTDSLERMIEDSSENPYMVIDKVIIRDWGGKTDYSTSEEDRFIKSHKRILLQSEEKNEDGFFERIKIRGIIDDERDQSEENRNLGRVKIYSAKRQFKKNENNETVLDEVGVHDLSQETTLYDDAVSLNGEEIFSKDTMEYFEVQKKGNRKQTAYGIFLLGEFVSADQSIVKDRSEVFDKAEGHFSLKQRADLEKTVYAMKKSAFFNHVNARSLQYYMGYRAEEEYAGKINKMMRLGFKNPLKEGQPDPDTYNSYQNYYQSFEGIFDANYLSDVNEHSGDELPNQQEANLEQYIITGVTNNTIEQSINKRETSNFVMVKVLLDRIFYDKKRGKPLFDGNCRRIPHPEGEETKQDMLVDRIRSLKQGEFVLRQAAIWLLSTDNPENWDIARGICMDESLLDLNNNPALKTRMKLAKADDGMIWRMELMDELSRNRSLNNEKLFDPAKQVIEEDKASQRGQVSRERQFAKIMVKAAGDMATNAISVINLDIENKWLKMSKTFVSTLSSLYPDNYTTMLSGALKEVGDAGLAIGSLSNLEGKNEKQQFQLFDEGVLSLSAVVNVLKTSYILYHFARKNPDPEKLNAKKIIPLTRSMIDLWSTVIDLFNHFMVLDASGFASTIFSVVSSGLDMFRNSIEIDEANRVQSNVDGLLSVKRNVEEKVKATDHTEGGAPTEHQKEVVNRFDQSGQYEHALSMAKMNADRKEVGGKVAMVKDGVDIAAALVGLTTGKVGKLLSKATAKLIGTGMDLGMMKYSMVKDEKETREDLLGKGLKNDKLDIDSTKISRMDKSVLSHALNRTTGISGFDYLLDSSRLMVAIDVHCAFQRAIGESAELHTSAQGQAQDQTQTQGQTQAVKRAHEAVAVSIAKAIMPDKYAGSTSAEDLKDIKLDDLLATLGFYGNRLMFTRNATGFDKVVHSYSDLKRY